MNMTPEALEALKASIVKWEANERAETWEDVRIKAADCPLCDLFAFCNGDDFMRCNGCPITDRSREYVNCHKTPYGDAYHAYVKWRDGTGTREAFRAAAHAETEFLRSLLPEGETV